MGNLWMQPCCEVFIIYQNSILVVPNTSSYLPASSVLTKDRKATFHLGRVFDFLESCWKVRRMTPACCIQAGSRTGRCGSFYLMRSSWPQTLCSQRTYRSETLLWKDSSRQTSMYLFLLICPGKAHENSELGRYGGSSTWQNRLLTRQAPCYSSCRCLPSGWGTFL